MLTIQPTKHLTGVTISGDYWDIDELLTAIYSVCGDEKRYYDFQGSRRRILAVCLKLRNAIRAQHNIEFVPNGIHKGVKHSQKLLVPEKNIYFSVEVLMPEIIFTTIALNDFIQLHQEIIDASDWNIHVATLRHFQGIIGEMLKEFIVEEHFTVFMQMLHTKHPTYYRYATQYVDVLNLEYIALSKEERAEAVAAFALRLLMKDEDYNELHEQLMAVASQTKISLHEMDLSLKYPEEIFW